MKTKTIFLLLATLMQFFAFKSFAQEQGQLFNLGQIVVTPTKTETSLKEVMVETNLITKREVESSNAQTISDALKYIPGIAIGMNKDADRTGNLNWRASMRGLRFNEGYGLILIDGERVKGGGMGEYGYGINQIPTEMIERIEIVKGPSSVLYGSDAISGVINLITKAIPKEFTASCYGGYGTHEASNAGCFLGKSLGKFGYLLNYSREKSEGGKYGGNDKYEANFGEAKINFAPTKRSKISLKINSNSKNWAYTDWNSRRVSPKFEKTFTDGSKLNIKGYLYKWDFHHFSPGYTETKGYMRYSQGEFQYLKPLSKKHSLLIGGEYLLEKMKYNLADKTITTDSVFLQDEMNVLNNLALNIGARFDSHSQFDSQISPRINMLYNINSESALRASVGKGFKSPTIRQLYYNAPFKHGTYYISSNPNLKPEKSIGYSISIEQLIKDKIILNAGLFRNEIKNMVLEYDTGSTYLGTTLKSYQNTGKALTQGLEFSLNIIMSNEFSSYFSYTYLNTEDRDSGKELSYQPRHCAGYNLKYANNKLKMKSTLGIKHVGKMYKNSSNTSETDSYFATELKLEKEISEFASVSIEADNIFKTNYGNPTVYSEGQTFMGKFKIFF